MHYTAFMRDLHGSDLNMTAYGKFMVRQGASMSQGLGRAQRQQVRTCSILNPDQRTPFLGPPACLPGCAHSTRTTP